MKTVLGRSDLRWRTALSIAILIAIAAASCGDGNESGGEPEDAAELAVVSVDTEQPRRGGTLRVAVVKGHSTFDPPVVLTIPDILFTQQAYDNLVLRDPDSLNAVRAVHRGESLIEPGVAAKVLSRFAQLSRQGSDSGSSDGLSGREIEVLQLMAKGAANKSIAGTLNISESTVKTHVANIFQKLDVNHRTEAVTQALQRGIINL